MNQKPPIRSPNSEPNLCDKLRMLSQNPCVSLDTNRTATEAHDEIINLRHANLELKERIFWLHCGIIAMCGLALAVTYGKAWGV